MLRVFALLGAGFLAGLVSAGDLVETRDLQDVLPVEKNPMDQLGAMPMGEAATNLKEEAAAATEQKPAKKEEKKLPTTLTLFPSPTPNFLAALVAGVLWLMIFCTGFCALFGLETPQKFVEKGLVMSKEY